MILVPVKISPRIAVIVVLTLGLFTSMSIQAGQEQAQFSESVQNPPPPFPPPGPWPPPLPPPPVERGRVCFFDGVNFSGPSFCVQSGSRMIDLRAWRNRISSISVEGSAEAKVCLAENLRGDCLHMSWSVSDLTIYGDFWNNAIHSLEVR